MSDTFIYSDLYPHILSQSLIDNARIEQARKVLSAGGHRNMPWPAVIATTREPYSHEEIRQWAEDMLQGKWAYHGYVYFIKDERDLMLFTLKWG